MGVSPVDWAKPKIISRLRHDDGRDAHPTYNQSNGTIAHIPQGQNGIPSERSRRKKRLNHSRMR
jgi:hypothetical protein